MPLTFGMLMAINAISIASCPSHAWSIFMSQQLIFLSNLSDNVTMNCKLVLSSSAISNIKYLYFCLLP